MDASLKTMNLQIQGYEERIAEEMRRLEVNTQAKREETNQKIQEAADRVKAAAARFEALQAEHVKKSEEKDTAFSEGAAAEQAVNAIRADIDRHNHMIKQCEEQQQNDLAPYGRHIKGVVTAIQRLTWFGQKPVGPFGMHVKVHEPEKWASLMRSQLGSFMSSFACTDSRDRAQLKKLLQESGKQVDFSSMEKLPLTLSKL